MTRLAFIGGAGAYHARAFACLINKHDRQAWSAAGMPAYDREPLDNAEVVAIWDPDHAEAQKLAALARIPHVLDKMEAAVGLVDGVLILDDITMKHQARARPFLEAGMPTFIDKPLSPDPAEAADLIALAKQSGAPMMSCSALRYSKELADAQNDLANIGRIICATATGPSELVFYGIHPLELAHTVMGPGVEWVQNIGDEQRSFARCAYPDGRSIILQVLGEASTGLQATFFGEKGWRHVNVTDAGHFYQTMLAAFVRMVETREIPIPLETTLELMLILAAAKRSQQRGSVRVTLSEMR